MNRMEFFKRLEYLLRELPESERMDALAYYNDYFDEAGVENEQRVIQELGSPESVAEHILADYRQQERYAYTEYQQTAAQSTEKKKLSTGMIVLIVVLAILTFPIWIGIVAGLFGVLIGLLGAVLGVLIAIGASAIGILIGGIACVIAGIFAAVTIPLEGMTMIGIGALLVAAGVLLLLLFVLVVGKWLPLLIKTLVKAIKGLRHRKEGGNEI